MVLRNQVYPVFFEQSFLSFQEIGIPDFTIRQIDYPQCLDEYSYDAIISKTQDSSSSLDQMLVLGAQVPYPRVLSE